MMSSNEPDSRPADSASKSTTPPASGRIAKSAPKKKKYVPAVTPRLKIALVLVFGLFGLLLANSIYLASITVLNRVTGNNYEDFFYLWMFLVHVTLGVLLVTPFIIFAFFHLKATRKRKNRRAVRIGYALLAICLTLLISGFLLPYVHMPYSRQLVYAAHVLSPLAAIWLYWLHRLAGPPIKWKVGLRFAGVVGVILLPMIYLQFQDPRAWSTVGSPDGLKYFQPSLAVTATGEFIPAEALDHDEYCLRCHQDVYETWSHSAHRFSSFNNQAYLTSVVELRNELIERDGNVKASRWCAGCHDPVPFFSGKFDNPDYDVFTDPTASAGITCTTCHAITNVNSHRGNADYTIEEPIHYPFAYSENSVLQWINNQLVKAKPAFHKATMLKPLHKTSEFCATCHKVHLPGELTEYKDFLRGQNHYDSWLLSGVSGHGIQSFYYPPEAEVNCNRCHMPLMASDDLGSRDFDSTGTISAHNHLFPSANTALAWLRDKPEIIAEHQEFLDGVMRVDIFGIKEELDVSAPLIGPIRPEVPTLEPGRMYLLETVIRTVKMGHLFTQGTADSNEVWMDVTVIEDAVYDPSNGERIGGRVVGRSGGMDEHNAVDPWAHYVNIFMLDRNGDRINRRNAHNIFTPFYNHQIPPGAGQVVHYELYVPEEINGSLTVEVELQYRKFDQEYMDIIAHFHEQNMLELRGEIVDGVYRNDLPVTTLATDRVEFPIAGVASDVAAQTRDDIPLWQRWNDYGIGLLTEGASLQGSGELLQAEQAFEQVAELDRFDGPINLARVYINEGDTNAAIEQLANAAEYAEVDGYPAWTVHWLNGVVASLAGDLEQAADNFNNALNYQSADTIARKFDFSRDYRVINELGKTYFDLAKKSASQGAVDDEQTYLELAVIQYERTLSLDLENADAHNALAEIYGRMENESKATFHRDAHQRYKRDDNAGDTVRGIARQNYPGATEAAEALTFYPLNREDAPELPAEAVLTTPSNRDEARRPTESDDADTIVSQSAPGVSQSDPGVTPPEED